MENEGFRNDGLTPEQRLWEAVAFILVEDYVLGLAYGDKANSFQAHDYQVSQDLLFGYTQDCFNGICQSCNMAASKARKQVLAFLNETGRTNKDYTGTQNLGKKILGRHNFFEEAKYKRSWQCKKRTAKRLQLKLVKQ